MAAVFQLNIPNALWQPAEVPKGPAVGIRLGQHGYAGDGSITIGPYMTSAAEVDRTIDALIAELEKIRELGKQELSAQHR